MTEAKITKDTFVEILREIGLDETQMHALHHKSEERYPQDHARLLDWLRLDSSEVDSIRTKSYGST